MQASESRKTALCGVMGALCFVILLMGGVIPFATFCAPAISGFIVLAVSLECGVKYAVLLYLAVGLLALLLVPDPELSCMFVALLGYYPMLRKLFEKIPYKSVRLLAKLALFNGVIVVVYGLISLIWPVIMLDMNGAGNALVAAMLLLGNITFLIYDLAILTVQRAYMLYIHRVLHRFSGAGK